MSLSSVPVVPVVNVYGGDTLDFPVYEFDTKDGNPVDVSGWTWTAQWRKSPNDPVAIDITVDDSNAAIGQIKLSLSAADTVAMKGPGVWDLQGAQADTIQTWLTGTTLYFPDITRG